MTGRDAIILLNYLNDCKWDKVMEDISNKRDITDEYYSLDFATKMLSEGGEYKLSTIVDDDYFYMLKQKTYKPPFLIATKGTYTDKKRVFVYGNNDFGLDTDDIITIDNGIIKVGNDFIIKCLDDYYDFRIAIALCSAVFVSKEDDKSIIVSGIALQNGTDVLARPTKRKSKLNSLIKGGALLADSKEDFDNYIQSKS